MVNLADGSDHADVIGRFRALLIEELKDRPEGFVQDGDLRPLGGPTPDCLPAYAVGDSGYVLQ
jgi:hypothetical protein